MHLDERLFTDLFVDQELRDELTLVALKLNDVSVFRILNDASVAVEPLFAFLENDLLVDLRIDSLRERSKIYKVERVSQSSCSAVNEARARSLSLSRTCPCDSRARLSARRRAPAQSSNSFVRCVVARECECSCLARNPPFLSSSFRSLLRLQSRALRSQRDRSLE